MSKQFNSRTNAHIAMIEFAPIQEGHVIVRITCRTSRPTATTSNTYIVKDRFPGRPGVWGIRNAISLLREQHPGTKIVLDPEANLQPIEPLAKWRFEGEEALYRARLGMSNPAGFTFTGDRDELASFGLDSEDVNWLIEHAGSIATNRSQKNGAGKANEFTI